MLRITPTHSRVSSGNAKISQPKPVEPTVKVPSERETPVPVDKPFVERRKSKDRRKHSAARGPYDLRSRGDRRKSGRKGQFIETEA